MGYLSQCNSTMWTLDSQCLAMANAENFVTNLRQVSLSVIGKTAQETGDSLFLGVNQNNQFYLTMILNRR